MLCAYCRRCDCSPEWGGHDCSVRQCLGDCSGHGACLNGTCWCKPGYGGLNCALRTCPSSCSGNGWCRDGECLCYPGFGRPRRLALACCYICVILRWPRYLVRRRTRMLGACCTSIPDARQLCCGMCAGLFDNLHQRQEHGRRLPFELHPCMLAKVRPRRRRENECRRPASASREVHHTDTKHRRHGRVGS